MGFFRFLLLNRRGAWFLVLFLLLHVPMSLWFGESILHVGPDSYSESHYGYGPFVFVSIARSTWDGPVDAIRVNWRWVAVALAGTYVLAALIGRWVTHLVGRGRPRHILRWVVLGVVAAALIGAITISKTYWGYCLSRPRLDGRIANAREVRTLTPVSTATDQDGDPPRFVIDPAYSIVKTGDTSPGGYYELELRVVHALQNHGKLPGPCQPLDLPPGSDKDAAPWFNRWQLSEPVAQMDPQAIGKLYALVASTGMIYEGSWGGGGEMSGIIIEATGRDGEDLLFFGLAGNQAANDHFPYYELLFRLNEDRTPKLLSKKRFFFDNAGIEGFEWPSFFIGFSVLGLLVTLPITIVVLAVRMLARRRRAGDSQPSSPA